MCSAGAEAMPMPGESSFCPLPSVWVDIREECRESRKMHQHVLLPEGAALTGNPGLIMCCCLSVSVIVCALTLFGNSTNVSIQTSWWEAKKSAKMWKWSLWHKTDSLDSNSKNYVSTFTLVFTGVVEVTSLQSQTIRNYIPQPSSDDDMTHYGFTDQFTKLTESNNNVTFS